MFLSDQARPRSDVERYRLGILMGAIFGSLLASLTFALQSFLLPMAWPGRVSISLLPLLCICMLIYVHKTGNSQRAALSFGLLAAPLLFVHILALKTVYVGFFHWVPWMIVFVSLLAGRRPGLLIAAIALLSTSWILQVNGLYGHSLGAYGHFEELLLHLMENHVLALLAITAMMFPLALHNDRMELELEKQHVLRAQNTHKTMMGAMLGNLAHEVNNPLAIVDTALLYYQNLLASGKLDAKMQDGLMQRIDDALKRLRAVVSELNAPFARQEGWGPSNQPAASATVIVRSQFAETAPRMTISHSFRSKILSRLRSVMQKLMAALDLTLPRVTRTWPTTQRFRARTAALICTLGIMAALINLTQMLIERADKPVLWTGIIFVGLGSAGMVALKTVQRPQLIATLYILILYATLVYLAASSGRSVLVPALHWFPHLITGLFLVARPRTALLASLFLVLGDALLLSYLRRYGLQLSFEQPFDQYLLRLHSTAVLIIVTMLGLATAFISLTNATYKQLVAEKDWHLLAARMRELNALADSAAILIGEPLEVLQDLLRELRSDGRNLSILQKMQLAVRRIDLVSKSFSLLSKPPGGDTKTVMSGRIWLEHIQNICFRRAVEAGWSLLTLVEPEHALIQGPIGRLTMLAITLLKEAIGHKAPVEGSVVTMRVRVADAFTHLHIHYRKSPQSQIPDPQANLDEAMRLALLEELLALLQASLQRWSNESDTILEVKWPHKDFDSDSRL